MVGEVDFVITLNFKITLYRFKSSFLFLGGPIDLCPNASVVGFKYLFMTMCG